MSGPIKLQLYHIGALERSIAGLESRADRLGLDGDYNAEFPSEDARALREVLDMVTSAALVGSI